MWNFHKFFTITFKSYIKNKILLKMFWDWHSFLICRLSNSLLVNEIDAILPKMFFARNVATKSQVTVADFMIFVLKGTVRPRYYAIPKVLISLVSYFQLCPKILAFSQNCYFLAFWLTSIPFYSQKYRTSESKCQK